MSQSYHTKIDITFKREDGQRCYSTYYMPPENGIYDKFRAFSETREEMTLFSTGLEEDENIECARIWSSLDDIIQDYIATCKSPDSKQIYLLQSKIGNRYAPSLMFAASNSDEVVLLLLHLSDLQEYSFLLFAVDKPWDGPIYLTKEDVRKSLQIYHEDISIQIK
jgi:hypothetical protein